MKGIIIIGLLVVAVVFSGCVDNRPMHMVVEYPVMIDLENTEVKIILDPEGTAEFWSDDTMRKSEWKIVHEEPDKIVFHVSTNAECLSLYRVMDPEVSCTCNDLILYRDGSAKLGSSKKDMWTTGRWF